VEELRLEPAAPSSRPSSPIQAILSTPATSSRSPVTKADLRDSLTAFQRRAAVLSAHLSNTEEILEEDIKVWDGLMHLERQLKATLERQDGSAEQGVRMQSMELAGGGLDRIEGVRLMQEDR
jgi:hypothetical protein